MIINLNQPCNVILTAHGAEVYNEYFRELYATCKLIELTNLKAEDELSLQLWELMSIFGTHLYNGAENCFANNDISFNDKVVKIPERSREEIKELLANWKGTLLVGDDISPSPWISVKERLPEATDKFGRSEDVLILDENGWRTVAMYCIPENKWYLSVEAIQGDCEYTFEITHWMPIPKLQEE